MVARRIWIGRLVLRVGDGYGYVYVYDGIRLFARDSAI
jgi:hypothetical protein